MSIRALLFKKKSFLMFNKVINADSRNVLILFILSLFFFHSILYKSDHIIYSDFSDVIAQHISWKSLINGAGQFSLWDPYTFSGSPAFANPQSMFVYPLHFLFYLMPIESAFGYTFFLHVFLSGLFMFYWIKSIKLSKDAALIAASLYMLNTTFILKIHAGWISMYPVIMVIPLLFCLLQILINKKHFTHAIYLGLAFGLVLYTSNYQLMLYAICFLFLYLLLRFWLCEDLPPDNSPDNCNSRGIYKRTKEYFILNANLLVSIFIGILLASYQLFPVYELKSFSTRQLVSSEFTSLSALNWKHLLTMLSPEIFGSVKENINLNNELWETCFFAGIASIYFFGLSFFHKKKKEIILMMSLALTVLLFVMNQTVQKFCFYFIPFFKYFMQPERIIPLFIFFFITLAGYGIEHFFNQEDKKKSIAFNILIYLLVAVLVSFNLPPFKAFFPEQFFTVSFLPAAFLFILYNAIYHSNAKIKNNPNILKATVFILVIFELFFYGMKYIDVRKTNAVFPVTGVTEYLKNDSSVFRVLAAGRTTIPYGQAGYHKIQIVNGYNPINISRYIEFTDVIRDKTNALPIKWLDFTEIKRMPLLDFLNVKYIVTNKPINDRHTLKLIYHENAEVLNFYAGMEKVSLYLYKNMNSLPRAYIVNNVKTIDGPSENVKKALEKFDPYITAIIEKPVPLQFKELAFTEDKLNGNEKEVFIRKVEIESYGNDEIKLKTSLDQKGFMVFSDLYYPGWELWDNGKRVNIFRTNYSFRGVFLDRGDHNLLFKFNPKLYTRGAIVSLISGIFVFILLIRCNILKVKGRKYCIF